jgi:hypothetical protein
VYSSVIVAFLRDLVVSCRSIWPVGLGAGAVAVEAIHPSHHTGEGSVDVYILRAGAFSPRRSAALVGSVCRLIQASRAPWVSRVH